MTQLFEQKSLLAKLLASENIAIEHRKVPTAYFDLENRAIILPIFKEMTGEVYDLLVGHEVSHALNTPKQGWHDALVDDRKFKSYLNVIEDARIERKIKEKFPGLRRSFNLAYKKLHEDNFFGLKNRDVNRMRLIDRINVFYKLGGIVKVTFAENELPILSEINAAETWEDVERIARKLYNEAKEKAKDEPHVPVPFKTDDEDDQDEDQDLDGNYIESDDFDDEENDDEYESGGPDYTDSDEDSDDEEIEEKKLENEGSEPAGGKEGGSSITQQKLEEQKEPDVSSETDNAFRENEKKLVDDSDGTVYIANLPHYNGNHIVHHDRVYNKIDAHFNRMMADQYDSYAYKRRFGELVGEYQEFVKRSSPVVNYMVKEFEIRKNASQLARAKVGKSGKINPKKLARYSMTTDIFQRVTTIPQGKNHGLVMFIDLSGSMANIIQNTIEQAIVLTQFCKKINIPFEVYGFSDAHASIAHFFSNYERYKYCNLKENDLMVNDCSFHIKQYLSSTMSASKYREACIKLHHVATLLNTSRSSRYSRNAYMDGMMLPPSEHLGGTPLDEALISSIDIVSKFKSVYRLDNVNCIFLTDGEGGMNNQIYNSNTEKYINYKSTLYIQDLSSKIRVRCESLVDRFSITRAIIQVAKKVTGAKYTGYYIATKRNIWNKIREYEYNNLGSWQAEKEAQYNENAKIKEVGYRTSARFGFNEYFMVLPENLKIEENKLDVEVGAKKGVIGRAFIKNMKGRGLQRMFLNKFMDNIAA